MNFEFENMWFFKTRIQNVGFTSQSKLHGWLLSQGQILSQVLSQVFAYDGIEGSLSKPQISSKQGTNFTI